MDSDLALALAQQMLWTAAKVAGPIIVVSMVVGLVISVFQVVTQIQEMTLTFIPKLGAVFVVLLLLGSWMLSVVVMFASTLISNIPAYISN